MKTVAPAWEAVRAGKIFDPAQVRPIIRTSWQRSLDLGIDPYLDRLPQVPVGADETPWETDALVLVTKSYLKTLFTSWPDERFFIGVTDRHGRLLQVECHPLFQESLEAMHAIPGAGMAEEHIGTAITSLVLAQDRPDWVLWSEHYCQAFHRWASIGAPIHDSVTNEIIGVLASVQEDITHPHALEVVSSIARNIEQLLHQEELHQRVQLLDDYQRFLFSHRHDIILAIDGRGHICGASPSACELFHTGSQFLNAAWRSIPDLQIEGLHAPGRDQDLQPYELTIRSSRLEKTFRTTALPVKGQRQLAGTLLVVSPAKPARPPQRRNAGPWAATYTFEDLVGSTDQFAKMLDLGRQAALHDFPVLLVGESGTGKELLAQAIHRASARNGGPFVPVNCGATSDELLAAELFGYAEGAFTGAVRGGRKGKFELAHTGTLFLDEVEFMSPKMQVSLLRLLEEGQISRVGAERPIAANVRVIAASQNLTSEAVAEGRFRLDLYHRLAVVPIRLPPLREHVEDILQLARHLLNQSGFPSLQIDAQAIRTLKKYNWPGNVRELRNVLLRAAHLANGAAILPADLPSEVQGDSVRLAGGGSLRKTEQALIRLALTEVRGNVAQAAAYLGIHRVTLYRKMKRYGIVPSKEDS